MVTAAGDTASTNANTAVTKSLAADGASSAGQALTYAKASGPSHGAVTVAANGSYTYMPSANYVGTDSFTYTVTDASGYTATNTVTVTVADVVTAAADTASTAANTAVTKSLAADGASSAGQSLTYAKASGPSHGGVTVSANGSYTYTPAPTMSGPTASPTP